MSTASNGSAISAEVTRARPFERHNRESCQGPGADTSNRELREVVAG
jgi:hypothetical protein